MFREMLRGAGVAVLFTGVMVIRFGIYPVIKYILDGDKDARTSIRPR